MFRASFLRSDDVVVINCKGFVSPKPHFVFQNFGSTLDRVGVLAFYPYDKWHYFWLVSVNIWRLGRVRKTPIKILENKIWHLKNILHFPSNCMTDLSLLYLSNFWYIFTFSILFRPPLSGNYSSTTTIQLQLRYLLQFVQHEYVGDAAHTVLFSVYRLSMK